MAGNQTRFVESSNSDIKKMVANAVPENMNQKRRVFEFLIKGALRELISHDGLTCFGPMAVEITKCTCFLMHRYQITTAFFTMLASG